MSRQCIQSNCQQETAPGAIELPIISPMATESSCGFLLSSEICRQEVDDEASKAGDMISSFRESPEKLLVFPRATKVSDRMCHKKQRNMHARQSRKIFQKMESAVLFSFLFLLLSFIIEPKNFRQSHFQATPSIQSRLVSLYCMWQNPCRSRIIAYNQILLMYNDSIPFLRGDIKVFDQIKSCWSIGRVGACRFIDYIASAVSKRFPSKQSHRESRTEGGGSRPRSWRGK